MILSQNCWSWTWSPSRSLCGGRARGEWETRASRGTFPSKTCSKSWDTASIAMGKESQGADRTLCKVLASWWRDRYTYTLKTKCRTVLSHVYGTALNGSVSWPWGVTMLAQARLGGYNSASLFSSPDVCGRKLDWPQAEDSSFFAFQMEEDGLADVGRKNSGQIWTTELNYL